MYTVCVPVWVHVHGVGVCGGQKEEWKPLVLSSGQLELPAVGTQG